ncbi:MAG: aminopeptidase [FCB group bacterium]|jgi:aminopeptidase|nr:aminopeptidase [FCB group bacterium]
MRDPRLDKLAQVLVNYSAKVQPGNIVRIVGAPVAEPLVVALFREVVRRGAHPVVRMGPEICIEIFLLEASDEQLQYLNPLAMHEVETIDCSIGIWADTNTRSLTNVDPARQAMAGKARKPISTTFLKRAAEGKLHWAGTQYPTQASAQDAEMSLTEYEDFVFGAGLLHLPDPAAAWEEIHNRQQRVCDVLNTCRELHFTSPGGTDLTLGVEARQWVNCDGHENFPDGEVFTGPIENATNGLFCPSFPAVHNGREVDGIRIRFQDGRAVDASAEKGEAFLIQMLDQDPGARILGEVAIGTNYSITRYTRNTLFDEKIGGTFHAALGAAYPETGGKNESALHWDLVCDLRNGGRIEADGKLISENGRFLDPAWPQP